ncbi:MAG: di-heme oxidoredictase family protein [Pseudomonadota bacterium]|nr:di-heme oxidoredictase family protein [Pseudomonadota bacterium]
MRTRPLPGLLLAAVFTAAFAVSAAEMNPDRRAAILAPATDFTAPEQWEDLSGGTATNRSRFDQDAYSQPSASLSFAGRSDFAVGNGIFRRLWVSSPSSTASADGLGPLYNARACQRCHLKDGRGHPPGPDDTSAVSMFLRLSVPPATEAERLLLASGRASVIPEPTYGGQLQDLSAPGVPAEGRMVVRYRARPVRFDDGTVVELRAPEYGVADLAWGPLHADAMLSPRVTPPMIGLGLLEAVDPKDILALADPDDRDGDGISGRPNRAWSKAENRLMLGRFGWKAGNPTIADQAAGAMAGDIGISSPLAPDPWGDCTGRQAACRDAPHGAGPGEVEASADMMRMVNFYSRHLAVPARRDAGDPEVLAGKRLFYGAGCIACHTPKLATRRDWPDRALAGQLIWPYTDMLLHDMGEGLADNRPEGQANGREWRTAPLWGIGLTATVNDHTFFLHDGRARNLEEAILWHGGEAAPSQARYRAMSAEDRARLIRFLESL